MKDIQAAGKLSQTVQSQYRGSQSTPPQGQQYHESHHRISQSKAATENAPKARIENAPPRISQSKASPEDAPKARHESIPPDGQHYYEHPHISCSREIAIKARIANAPPHISHSIASTEDALKAKECGATWSALL